MGNNLPGPTQILFALLLGLIAAWPLSIRGDGGRDFGRLAWGTGKSAILSIAVQMLLDMSMVWLSTRIVEPFTEGIFAGWGSLVAIGCLILLPVAFADLAARGWFSRAWRHALPVELGGFVAAGVLGAILVAVVSRGQDPLGAAAVALVTASLWLVWRAYAGLMLWGLAPLDAP